jgi:hypothetical protein
LRTESSLSARVPNAMFIAFAMLLLVLASVRPGAAQVTPAAGYTPPDDTPSIKVGATIFSDFTWTRAPQSKDSDGNLFYPNSFNVSRAYINLTGNVSHIVAFRVTSDVTRETGTGSSLNGSLTYRLKYAFAQINLDDWMPKGTWVRFGIQQTPFIDFEEGVYRYRFQGTVFLEREGYQSSSDAGVSFHTAFPQNYGDVHVGVYNGEGYSKAEANNEKAVMIRATLRPLPRDKYLRGLRVTGFYTRDNYVMNAQRRRALLNVLYEHQYATVGLDYLSTNDQTSATAALVDGKGWSIWATPKFGKGFEALVRYEDMQVNKTLDTRHKRTIAGLSYWFPHQGTVSAALLLDFEQVTNVNFTPSQPTGKKIFVHSLISF